MNDRQALTALRWLFYAFAIACLYFAIRDWVGWGWRGGIGGGAVAALFLFFAVGSGVLLRRAVIVILALFAITAFLSAWMLLGYLAAQFWGDTLMTFLWLAGSVFGFIHSRRLSKSMRTKQNEAKGQLARPLPRC